MNSFSYHYRIENIKVPHHMIHINVHWRKLPIILENIRSVPVDIRWAHVGNQSTVFILRSGDDTTQMIESQVNLANMLRNLQSKPILSTNVSAPLMRLPLDTQVLVYNTGDANYTTMEFGCKDRIGLLSDLLQFLEPLNVEIQYGYVTTIDDMAYNIFHLQKDNQRLSHQEIQYITNVFEHEAKERIPNQPLM